MDHAFKFRDAVEVYADGPVTEEQCMGIVCAIAAEYDITCRYITARIAHIAKRAGRPWQPASSTKPT